ncbi:hypothetical protein ACGFNU_42250 [Spirillospora sp. NPDC048911]|uniref:hypothetical protein n=1 Tax=Spirillospora sp. NPDC048911 TaxID=3364527 RepID=UPI00371AC2B3
MRARLVRSVPPPGPRRALTGAAAAALLVLTGCGTDKSSGDFEPQGAASNGNPATDPTQQAAPPTMSRQQIDKLVLQRYREYQRVYKRVYQANDPAPLNAVVTEPLLSSITKDVEAMAAKNEIWRFTNIFNPRVQSRSQDGTAVNVIDCVRTLAAYRYSTKTGKRLGGGPGDAVAYLTTLKYDAGTWKVADSKRGNSC